MPYYLHLKGSEPETGECFLTQADAARALNPQTHKITLVASTYERDRWQQRERDRFYDGTYIEVPWRNYAFASDVTRYHFAHLSVKCPGLIAYTKNDDAGLRDIQTPVKPGKYLTEFYKDQFSVSAIAEYVAKCAADNLTLKFATTADDIHHVYIHGPGSCMAHSGKYSSECILCQKRSGDAHYRYESLIHPVRVYGDSDLSVAYFGPFDCPSARGLVWQKEKVYGRIYNGPGTAQGTLEALLKDHGFAKGSFDGAKIPAIKSGRSYVMPYIDYYDEIGLTTIGKKEFFVFGETGYACSRVDGLTAETENEDAFTCENCNDHFDSQDEYGGDGMCQSCFDEHNGTCEDCENTVANDDLNNINDRYVCDRCLSRNYGICEGCEERFSHDDLNDDRCESCQRDLCDCAICDTEFDRDEFTRSENRDRELLSMTDVCKDCADTHAYCESCADYYSTETDDHSADILRAEFAGADTNTSGIYSVDLLIPDTGVFLSGCSECGRTFRCSGTLDLFDPLLQNAPCGTLVAPTDNDRPEADVFPLHVYSLAERDMWSGRTEKYFRILRFNGYRGNMYWSYAGSVTNTFANPTEFEHSVSELVNRAEY
jgi:hypothetical protein